MCRTGARMVAEAARYWGGMGVAGGAHGPCQASELHSELVPKTSSYTWSSPLMMRRRRRRNAATEGRWAFLSRAASSSTGEPYSGRCPSPRRYPGWNGLHLSSRRSLSLVPPSAKSRRHLHEIFVNDACTVRWVNSTPAFSLIFSSAVTRHVR